MFWHRIRAIVSIVMFILMAIYAGVSVAWSNIVEWIPYQGALGGILPEVFFEITGVRSRIAAKIHILDEYDDIVLEMIAEYTQLANESSDQIGPSNRTLQQLYRYWNAQLIREYDNRQLRQDMPDGLANIQAAKREAELEVLREHAESYRTGKAKPATVAYVEPPVVVPRSTSASNLHSTEPRMVRRASSSNLFPGYTAARTKHTSDDIDMEDSPV